jgi:phage replication-related protein YjqB (UPF0714/DUF867 family)
VLDELLTIPGVEERCVLRSSFGFLALHGGLERGTAEIAADAAGSAGASLYAVVQPPDVWWHVPSHRYDPAGSAALARFLEHVDVVVSVHGYGGLRTSDARWTTALLGGSNRTLAARLGKRLRRALPEYTWLDDLEAMPLALRGLDRRNPVNLPRRGGVQIELPPRVRGIGPHWDGHPRPVPHTVTLVEALAALARDSRW